MSCYLKSVSVTLVAVVALAAVSSASAAKFKSESSGTTTFSGSQIGTDVFTTMGGTVECEEATYSGTQSGSEVAEVTATPVYSNCTALSGFAPQTIKMNGCMYKFKEPAGTTPTGKTDILCQAGQEITETATLFGTVKCVTHIPPQVALGTITYHNEGSGTTRGTKVTTNLTGIEYTETEGTGFGRCAAGLGTHHATNGTYTGERTTTATSGGAHVGIWVDAPSPVKFKSESAGTTSFTASQIGTDVLNTTGGTVECEEATFSGTQSGSEASTMTVTPVYANCSALSGFASAAVDMNECQYKFTEPTGTGTTHTGNMDITCPTGKEITVTASLFGTTKCTIHIPPQGPLGTITYHNEGSGTTRGTKVTTNLTGIEYTETEGTGFGRCAEGLGTRHATNGTYTGERTTTATSGGAHVGIWIE